MSRWSQAGFVRSTPSVHTPAQKMPPQSHLSHDQISSGGCSCHERWTCPGEHQPPLCPRKFLERYSLPRVVRVVPQQAGPGGAILSGDMSLLSGQLLMYRHYTSGKLEARSHTRSRGSSLLVIPDTYQGWFSVVTERGQVKARCYSTIQRLVTARVTAFLVVNDTTAYTLNNRLNIDGRRQQYTKTVARGGQVLKLIAVYQDVGGQASSAKTKRLSWPLLASRTESNSRYAQCLTAHDQVLYIPLTTPGQFYAVAGATNSTGGGGSGDDTVSKVYQLPRLLRTFPLPVRVCIINSCKPQGSMLLETYRKEEVILTCLLDPPQSSLGPPPSLPSDRFRLLEIDVNSKFFVVRPTKRLSDERRLFQSDRVQAALRFCHENWDKWSRQLKVIHHIYPKEVLHGQVVPPQPPPVHPPSVKQQARQAYRQEPVKAPPQQQQQQLRKQQQPAKQTQNEPVQKQNKPRKISLGDKKTVKSASFRFCTSYQPDDLRPVAARAPQEPAQQDDHIYSNVAEDEDKRHVSEDDRSDEDDWCGTERSVVSVGPPQSSASSYRTKISINDRGSEISWDIVNRVFSESGYSYNQELRRDAEAQWNKKPFYKTRLHVGAQLAPYASVRDRVEEGVYAEIGDSERYTSDSNTTSSLS